VPKLVRWHLWMTIISSVLLPIVEFVVLLFVLPSTYDSMELSTAVKEYEAQFILIGWFLFVIARLFFIAAMVKSVTSLNEQKKQDESTGFLDDFAQ
jgi:heme/copper-type cytochrome/quinol oxidase subunit 2